MPCLSTSSRIAASIPGKRSLEHVRPSILLRGQQDKRRADPFAAMGHTLANRYINGKTESNPGTRAGIKTLEHRQGKARQGKARQGKARQGKARQGKARQGYND